MNLVEIASKTDVDAFITDFSKSHINGKEDYVTFDLPSNQTLQFSDFVVTKISSIFGCTPLHTNVRIC